MPEPLSTPTQPTHGKTLLRWTFSEFVRHQRSKRWYAVAAVVGVATFFWAIISGNPLFAIILILIAIVYVSLNQRRPRLIPIAITEDGIEIDRDFYAWKDIQHFWIVYQPPTVKKLFFRFTGVLRPNLTIQLGKENPVTIRKTLLQFIPEDLNGDEPASEQLSRLLKL